MSDDAGSSEHLLRLEFELGRWRTALRGLVVGPEPLDPAACADNVRARLARMGGTEPVYLGDLINAAEGALKACQEGRNPADALAKLHGAVLFAQQVRLGAGSKANWGDLAGGEE